MEIYKKQTESVLNDDIIEKFKIKDYLFIDVEATGFNKIEDKIFSVSIGYFDDDNIYNTMIIFEENDEKLLMETLLHHIKFKEKWCTFNGMAFDEPFLKSRLNELKLGDIKLHEHLDFYRLIKPYKRALNLKGISLKCIESYLKIQREDNLNGEQCKDYFLEFLKTKNENIKKEIIMHNFEDVLYLPKLFIVLQKIKERKLKRDDIVTKSQVKFIKYLITKRKPRVEKIKYSNLSKKEASRMIFQLKQREIDEEFLNEIIKRNL